MPPHFLLAPSNSALSDALLIPSTSPALPKILSKLSRSSLLDLVLQWLLPQNQRTCAPFLTVNLDEDGDNEQSAYPPARTLDELRETYEEFQERKGAKGEVVDRVLEGDWRHGMSLHQLAMLDMQYLLDRQASRKWTALKFAHVTADDGEPLKKRQKTDHDPIPRLHATAFLRNLQSEISPVVKAHYHVHRPNESQQLPMTILRIYVTDTPYKAPRVSKTANLTFTDSSKTIYVAFPDSCPYVYISLSSAAMSGSKSSISSSFDTQMIKKLVIDAIPKALSSQHKRYRLETTSLSAKSLRALLGLRGNGKSNNSQGAFSIFANGGIEDSPLDPAPPDPQKELNSEKEQHLAQEKENANPYPTPENTQETAPQPTASQRSHKRPLSLSNNSISTSEDDNLKRRKAIASTRFGSSATNPEDGTGLDRFEIRLEEPVPVFPSTSPASPPTQQPAATRPPSRRRSTLFDTYAAGTPPSEPAQDNPAIRLTFSGNHVFAGMRALVETGVIDGGRMPRWLTGEEGVSVGVVRGGEILSKN